MINIAIDAMGGDKAPGAVVDGVRQALLELPEDLRLTLYGDEAALSPLIEEAGLAADQRVERIPTTEVISLDEQPAMAVRRKKDSSLVRAIADVSTGNMDCVLSAGSTGALLTGATLIIRRLDGVKRPALGVALPTNSGCALLIDSGANTDCKVEYLVQFALMGSIYMQRVMGVDSPRVGLLNNGAEAEKGNELTKAAFQALSASPIRFAGNCEARDAFSGEYDVIVADGFDGNVLLKAIEGTAQLLMDRLKEELLSDLRGKIGAAVAKPAFSRLKKHLDYSEYGGAPLIGVRGGVIKAHGSSGGRAFRSAILQAYRLSKEQVVSAVAESIGALPVED